MGEGLNEGKRNALEAPFNDKEIKDVVKYLEMINPLDLMVLIIKFIKISGKLLVMMSKHLLKIFTMGIYYLRA
jgi:hypothetical protein